MALFRTHLARYHRCIDHEDCLENHDLSLACRARHVEELHGPGYRPYDDLLNDNWEHVWSYKAPRADWKTGEKIVEVVDVFVGYVGRVVATWTDYNVRIMSDIWEDVAMCAVLEADGSFRKTHVHRFDSDDMPLLGEYLNPPPSWLPGVDAPQAEIDRYQAEEREKARLAELERAEYAAKCRAAAAEAERKAPQRGRTLRVVRGRKVKVGTEGVCFWVGGGKYGERVGMKVGDETVWTAASNVEAVS